MKITYGDLTITITLKTWEKNLAIGRVLPAEVRAGMLGVCENTLNALSGMDAPTLPKQQMQRSEMIIWAAINALAAEAAQ